MRGRKRSGGFTIIEILIAVVVSAIGFAAIFAMQIGSLQGNISAREMAAAVNLGERYVEMLEREAYMWNVAAERRSPWLTRTSGQWHSLTENPVDHNGRPHNSDDADDGSPLARQRFCVHYWFAPLDATYDGLLNVRVRVIWPRASLDTEPLYEICPEGQADAFEPNARDWFTITIPATVRRHPS